MLDSRVEVILKNIMNKINEGGNSEGGSDDTISPTVTDGVLDIGDSSSIKVNNGILEV